MNIFGYTELQHALSNSIFPVSAPVVSAPVVVTDLIASDGPSVLVSDNLLVDGDLNLLTNGSLINGNIQDTTVIHTDLTPNQIVLTDGDKKLVSTVAVGNAFNANFGTAVGDVVDGGVYLTFTQQKGANNGLAELGPTGTVPIAQLPLGVGASIVSTVLDIAGRALLTPVVGDSVYVIDSSADTGKVQPQSYIYDGSFWVAHKTVDTYSLPNTGGILTGTLTYDSATVGVDIYNALDAHVIKPNVVGSPPINGYLPIIPLTVSSTKAIASTNSVNAWTAFDNDNNSGWIPASNYNGGNYTGTGFTQLVNTNQLLGDWIQFEFDNPLTVNGWKHYVSNIWGRLKNMSIVYSSDASNPSNWYLIETSINNTMSYPSTYFRTFTNPPSNVKFIRIIVHSIIFSTQQWFFMPEVKFDCSYVGSSTTTIKKLDVQMDIQCDNLNTNSGLVDGVDVATIGPLATNALQKDGSNVMTGILNMNSNRIDNPSAIYANSVNFGIENSSPTGKVYVMASSEGSTNMLTIDPALSTVKVTNMDIDMNNNDVLNIGANGYNLNAHLVDSSIHFTKGSILHSNLQQIGQNSHEDIDIFITNTGTNLNNRLLKAGDSMTGQLNMNYNDPSLVFKDTTSATKNAVSSSIVMNDQNDLNAFSIVQNAGGSTIKNFASGNLNIVSDSVINMTLQLEQATQSFKVMNCLTSDFGTSIITNSHIGANNIYDSLTPDRIVLSDPLNKLTSTASIGTAFNKSFGIGNLAPDTVMEGNRLDDDIINPFKLYSSSKIDNIVSTVSGIANSALQRSGGQMSGAIDMNSNNIINCNILKTTDVDASTVGGTVKLGYTDASSVQISKSGYTSTIRGNCQINGTTSMQGNTTATALTVSNTSPTILFKDTDNTGIQTCQGAIAFTDATNALSSQITQSGGNMVLETFYPTSTITMQTTGGVNQTILSADKFRLSGVDLATGSNGIEIGNVPDIVYTDVRNNSLNIASSKTTITYPIPNGSTEFPYSDIDSVPYAGTYASSTQLGNAFQTLNDPALAGKWWFCGLNNYASVGGAYIGSTVNNYVGGSVNGEFLQYTFVKSMELKNVRIGSYGADFNAVSMTILGSNDNGATLYFIQSFTGMTYPAGNFVYGDILNITAPQNYTKYKTYRFVYQSTNGGDPGYQRVSIMRTLFGFRSTVSLIDNVDINNMGLIVKGVVQDTQRTYITKLQWTNTPYLFNPTTTNVYEPFHPIGTIVTDSILLPSDDATYTNNRDIVIGAGGGGYYQINGACSFALAQNGDLVTTLAISKNSGASYYCAQAIFNNKSGEALSVACSTIALLNAGDTLRLEMKCSNAVDNLNISSWCLAVHRIQLNV